MRGTSNVVIDTSMKSFSGYGAMVNLGYVRTQSRGGGEAHVASDEQREEKNEHADNKRDTKKKRMTLSQRI